MAPSHLRNTPEGDQREDPPTGRVPPRERMAARVDRVLFRLEPLVYALLYFGLYYFILFRPIYDTWGAPHQKAQHEKSHQG